MSEIVNIEHLVKRFKELTALDDFNLKINKGERLALLGPNGSGKTTAINCMLGLLKIDHGKIELFGEQMSPSKLDIKAKIGLVPQEPTVFNELNVYENIDYFCGLYEQNSIKRKELVNEAIKFVHLENYKKFRPKKLSGGLLRRLNIACGMAHKPEFLILDEPTVAVDAQTRKFMLDEIKKLGENGTTILYTTHYLEEVEEVAETIVIIEKGQAIAKGTSDELKSMISTTEKIVINLDDEGDRLNELKKLPNIYSIDFNAGSYHLAFNKGHDNIHTLINYLSDNDLSFSSIYSERPSLNDVFLELTGKDLRE